MWSKIVKSCSDPGSIFGLVLKWGSEYQTTNQMRVVVRTGHLNCRWSEFWTMLSPVQWGSEYRTSLVFKWSKVFRSPIGPVFKCHLNTGLNFVWYSDRNLNTRPVFEWWSEYQTTIWIPNNHLNTGHLNTGQVKVCYSDVSVIQMFVIQIPTVL